MSALHKKSAGVRGVQAYGKGNVNDTTMPRAWMFFLEKRFMQRLLYFFKQHSISKISSFL